MTGSVAPDQERQRRTLYVSAVLGGGEVLPGVERAIRRLAGIVRRVDETEGAEAPQDQAVIDVTFHVPGTTWPVDFVGLRTGRWVSAKRLLVVQVAVPTSLESGAEITQFLAGSLPEAVALARDRLTARRIRLSVERAAVIASRAAREAIAMPLD